MKSLSDDLLREMTRRLVEQFQPEQIILFGSHAWGTPTSDSDVDLLVIVTQSDLSDYERAVLGHRCLSGLNVPKDVMVQTRAEFDFFQPVRASLEYKIAAQGRVLYDRRQATTGEEMAHQSAKRDRQEEEDWAKLSLVFAMRGMEDEAAPAYELTDLRIDWQRR